MFVRKTLIVAFCLMMLFPLTGSTFGQDGCDAATINADMVALFTAYVAQQATAQDTEAALNLAETLNNDIADLLTRCGRGPVMENPPLPGGSGDNAEPEGGDGAEPEGGDVIADNSTPFSAVNTFGTPIGPAANFEGSCTAVDASGGSPRVTTENAFQVTTYLPGGEYRAILLPVQFATFDPILFVNAPTPDSDSLTGFCSAGSAAAREYVVDFSQGGIGRQVFGHVSGGVLEFVVPGGSTEVSPVEILVGGQDDSDAGVSGEFILIIEGARLTATVPEHVYNVTITDSLIESNAQLGVIAMGVNEGLDLNLRAGVYTASDVFEVVFTCEDAGDVDCQSDARNSLAGATVVEAAVRTVRGTDTDAAILVEPIIFLDRGIQDVSYVVSQSFGTPSREEYVIAFYGRIE